MLNNNFNLLWKMMFPLLKKKRIRDEKLEIEYLEVRSDFYLDIYDKSIIMKL